MVWSDMFAGLFDCENSGYRIVSTQGVSNIMGSHGGLSWYVTVFSSSFFFSKNKAWMLKDREETQLLYRKVLPALKLFCT